LFDQIMTFLNTITGASDGGSFRPDDARVAAVALCYQVMAADGKVTTEEQAIVTDMIRQSYGLDEADMVLLKKAGEKAESDAVDYFRFTSILKRDLTEDQRLHLIGVLWDIAYADGIRNEVEDHVIWRISDLMGVSGRDRVNQRIAAEERRKGLEEG
jgi:uncharacterized tellurite resistance protein B-like protein